MATGPGCPNCASKNSYLEKENKYLKVESIAHTVIPCIAKFNNIQPCLISVNACLIALFSVIVTYTLDLIRYNDKAIV